MINGIDDNCNGLTDENLGAPVEEGVGECRRIGFIDTTGEIVWLAPAVEPQPEILDGLDNDCDGAIDDGL